MALIISFDFNQNDIVRYRLTITLLLKVFQTHNEMFNLRALDLIISARETYKVSYPDVIYDT